ncbi:hypothetical protein [Gluconacetobacter asukensis]|uniref:hypothetical protein n=1 Tax=Gluconacetobacter asukensis TaxID=1017181 RepID=UPI0031E52BAE
MAFTRRRAAGIVFLGGYKSNKNQLFDDSYRFPRPKKFIARPDFIDYRNIHVISILNNRIGWDAWPVIELLAQRKRAGCT